MPVRVSGVVPLIVGAQDLYLSSPSARFEQGSLSKRFAGEYTHTPHTYIYCIHCIIMSIYSDWDGIDLDRWGCTVKSVSSVGVNETGSQTHLGSVKKTTCDIFMYSFKLMMSHVGVGPMISQNIFRYWWRYYPLISIHWFIIYVFQCISLSDETMTIFEPSQTSKLPEGLVTNCPKTSGDLPRAGRCTIDPWWNQRMRRAVQKLKDGE